MVWTVDVSVNTRRREKNLTAPDAHTKKEPLVINSQFRPTLVAAHKLGRLLIISTPGSQGLKPLGFPHILN